jgi:membrane protease YdiL (CAAX protease family)
MNARPRIWQVNLLLFPIAILIILLGGVAQAISVSWGLLFTEVVLILLPTLAFVAWGIWRGWFRPREVLALRRMSPSSVGLSLLMGLAGWPVASAIAMLTTKALDLMVGPYEVKIPPPSGTLDAVVYMIAFAVSAAVCEELLFRGMVMGAYRGQGLRLAVVCTAVLFGLFHFSLSSLLATTFIGLILGYAATRCQSVYASMLVHAANNTLAATVLIFQVSLLPLLEPALWVLAPLGAVVLILGGFLLHRHTAAPPEAMERDRLAWRDWAFWVTVLPIILVFLLMAALELVLRAGIFGALKAG